MKIEIWADTNTNIHSMYKEVIDVEDLGITEEDWNELTEAGKDKEIKGYLEDGERLSWGYKEL